MLNHKYTSQERPEEISHLAGQARQELRRCTASTIVQVPPGSKFISINTFKLTLMLHIVHFIVVVTSTESR